jgi:hypothetical protein
MANGLFSGFNPFVPKEDKQGADQYISETRFGELPPVGQTFGEGPQPIAIGEGGGSVVIDPTNPTTQARPEQMEAGFTQMGLPILGGASVLGASVGTQPSLVGAPRTTTTIPRLVGTGTQTFTGTVPPRPMPGTQLAPPTQPPAPAPSTAPRPVTGTARTVGSRFAGASALRPLVVNPYVGTAAALLAAEEVPKLFGSEKSTSEILTELAATSPEERAGATEYASLGANLPGLGGGISEPVSGEEVSRPTPNLSQFMRYDDAAETEQFVDPQGRLRIRMKDTKELAPQYRDYEAEAKAREERLRQRQALRERFPTGIPVGMIDESGEVTDGEQGVPDVSTLPSEIREIVDTPTQMRTPEQRTRLSRFFGTTLGRQFGSESAIKEGMMTPLQREIAETEAELTRQRAADLAAGREPQKVEYKTSPETGLIEQYVDGRLRNTFRPKEGAGGFDPNELKGVDKEAYEFAINNPDDPRSAGLLEKIKEKQLKK